MSGAFCPFCGKPTVPGATFCASCGAALPSPAGARGAVPSSPPFAAVPGMAPMSFGSPLPAPSAPSRAVDQRALGSVEWAAILSLVSAVVSLVALFGTNATSFVNATNVGSTTGLSIVLSALYLLAAIAGIGIVLEVVQLLLYRSAFRDLTGIDSRFSTPASLVLLELIGIVLVTLVAFGFFWIVLQAVACAGSGNVITSACLNVSLAIDLLGLLVVAGIVAFIGFIGLLIGIWRLGTRYDDSLFKAGAILLIFPILNLIGTILILVAAHSAKGRLADSRVPTTFG